VKEKKMSNQLWGVFGQFRDVLAVDVINCAQALTERPIAQAISAAKAGNIYLGYAHPQTREEACVICVETQNPELAESVLRKLPNIDRIWTEGPKEPSPKNWSWVLPGVNSFG
jgi:hypothetical protein